LSHLERLELDDLAEAAHVRDGLGHLGRQRAHVIELHGLEEAVPGRVLEEHKQLGHG